MNTRAASISFILFIAAVVGGTAGYAQHATEIPPRQNQDYGSKFFEQLQRMFERYTEGDLHHIFQMARPVPCSELANDQSEWRDVAFFSGRTKFGNWADANIDEVRSHPLLYMFRGVCSDERAPLNVTTKAPVYGLTPMQIQVKVNPPV